MTQEEEDARLARLLAETGQSFRDLDLNAAGKYSNREILSATPSLQNARRSPVTQMASPSPNPQYFEPVQPSPQGRGYGGDHIHFKPLRRSPTPQIQDPREWTPEMLTNYGRHGETQPLASKAPLQFPMQNEPPRNLAPNMRPNPVVGTHVLPPDIAPSNSVDGLLHRSMDPIPLDQRPLQPLGTPRQMQGNKPRSSPTNTRDTMSPTGMLSGAMNEPLMMPGDAFLDIPVPLKKEKKKGLLGMFGRNGSKELDTSVSSSKSDRSRGLFGGKSKGQRGTKMATELTPCNTNENPKSAKPTSGEEEVMIRFRIPDPVPRPADTIGASKGPLPYSLSISRDAPELPEATVGRRLPLSLSRNIATCAVCMLPAQNPISALDKKFHHECFRCITCHQRIDPSGAFAYLDNHGDKQPMHRKCYVEIFGIKCCVCKESIPAGIDGKVSFVKHPFFDTEQMCPKHARNMTRRCTGCHRFEPENEPFADLNDVGRCVCLACCRSVVVDSDDAQPLWGKVIEFFEQKLNMPIWKDFREVPILVVGYHALNDQMNTTHNIHGGASQIMTRGLCLTEHESGRRFQMNRMKFDKDSMSFVASDAEERGFTFFQVPDASKTNPDASVTAILCLSGLPRDLTASVLAHEATHAWIKLHPRFDFERPIPPQVEEGCAQLIALLFLNEGLGPPSPLENNDGCGLSDEKLRQYFRFSIETDEHEIYGTGYRRAALAYSRIGIEALMSHVVLYQNFPEV